MSNVFAPVFLVAKYSKFDSVAVEEVSYEGRCKVLKRENKILYFVVELPVFDHFTFARYNISCKFCKMMSKASRRASAISFCFVHAEWPAVKGSSFVMVSVWQLVLSRLLISHFSFLSHLQQNGRVYHFPLSNYFILLDILNQGWHLAI